MEGRRRRARDLHVRPTAPAVPLTILRQARQSRLDGFAPPRCLYGYGGYSISLQPTLHRLTRIVDRSAAGSTAEANLRGGNEFRRGLGTRAGKLHQQAARVRRLLRLRPPRWSTRAIPRARAPGDQRPVQRRPADGPPPLTPATRRCTARGWVSGRGHLRHAADRADPQRHVQHPRVRHGQGPGAVPRAVRLLAGTNHVTDPAVAYTRPCCSPPPARTTRAVDPYNSRKMDPRGSQAAGARRTGRRSCCAPSGRRRPRHRQPARRRDRRGRRQPTRS